MQSIKKQNYFIDAAQLPQGVSMEQVERVLAAENTRIEKRDEAIKRSLEQLTTEYRTSRDKILGAEANKLKDYKQQQYFLIKG